MNILSVDTTTKIASVCIKKNNDFFEGNISNEVTHSEKLLPLIDDILKKSGLNIKDIDMYACINGPGSFTGIRIGLATLKAFAMVNRKNIFSLPSDITISATSFLKNKDKKYFASLIDAKNSRVYYCLNKICMDDNKLKIEKIISTENELIDTALSNILVNIDYNENIVFCGDIKEEYINKIKTKFNSYTFDSFYPTSKDLINIYDIIQNTNDYIFDTYTLDANYVRASQAERIKENGK